MFEKLKFWKKKNSNNEIIITSQKEWDKLPDSFKVLTNIIIKTDSSFVLKINRILSNSTVFASGNSTVSASGNSTVSASGNSTVYAYGNSIVYASGNSTVYAYSESCDISLSGYAIVFIIKKPKSIKKTKTNTVIVPKPILNLKDWFEYNNIKLIQKVVLYKKVSNDFKTQENTKNETIWTIGKVLEHLNWTPDNEECGEGKYHACSEPHFCDQFRNNANDKYIAIEIDKKDLFVWKNPNYKHKIAFKKCKVLYECDIEGKIKKGELK